MHRGLGFANIAGLRAPAPVEAASRRGRRPRVSGYGPGGCRSGGAPFLGPPLPDAVG